nr:nestin isoform X2 [Meriones unguiculatus]
MEGCVGEESFQMWELNRRLEAYLTRVKTLEEQNQLLSAELGGLRAQSGDTSWRARADDELAALRVLVEERWREKHAVEVQRDNLAEELEGVAGRCQQVRLARERTCEELARNRRALEAEESARGWLSTQAAELERELEALRAAHEEERSHLNAQAVCAPRRSPAPPRGPPARAPEVEELAWRLGEAWRGAVRDYQERVAHMESSLGQARERLDRAVRGAREGRLELQQLQAERDSLQGRRDALEQRLEGRWQDRLQTTEKFQLTVEALEQEKQNLQSQIAQVLEGGQQLTHLKMSLSMEVATYRTLLEAENSRLQTPGRSSQAFLGFQDPKLKLHFLGTPENQHLGSVLPVLSPTSLPSPLPDTLETPVTAFLKTQEFLQAQTPTLASTPIPLMSEAPCPSTNAEIRAQDGPLSLLQTQGGSQQAPEPLCAEATVPISTEGPSELEEPGGKQPGHFPEDPASLAPSLNPHHPILEDKDGEFSESRVSSMFQENEGQIWELGEKEAAIEAKAENSLAQETQEGGLDTEEIQDSQGPLQKETMEAVGEKPLMCLKTQSHETQGKENCRSLRSVEKNLETLKSPEKEKQTLLKSLEEKDVEAEKTLENGVSELSKPLEKEVARIRDQELMSPEGKLETVSFVGKENQEVVKSLEEGDLELLTAFKKDNQHPLGGPEEEDPVFERAIKPEDQESLRSLEEEDQEAFKPLEKENLEPLRYEEAKDQMIERLVEKEDQKFLRSLEEEDQRIVKHLEKENQEFQRSLEEEEQMTERSLERENHEPLSSVEKKDQMIENLLEKKSQDSVKSTEDENQETLGKQNPESGQDQEIQRLEQETHQTPRAEEVDQMAAKPLEKVDSELLKHLGNDKEIVGSLEKEIQESLVSLKERSMEPVKSSKTENTEPLKNVQEDLEIMNSIEDQEPLWSTEVTRETMKPLENEIQELLGYVDENQETLRPLERENKKMRSLGKWDPETVESPEGIEERQQHLEGEECLEMEKHQESLRSLGEVGQLSGSGNQHQQQRWEDVVVENGAVGQDPPLGKTGIESEDEAELCLSGQDDKEEAAEERKLQQDIVREASSLGSSEMEEQRVPAEDGSRKSNAEALEGQPEQMGTLEVLATQGMLEVAEQDEDIAQAGEQDSRKVTLGLEAAGGQAAATGAGPGLEQEVVELEDPRHLASDLSLGEESVKAKIAQGLERPGKEPKEAGALESEILKLPKTNSAALEHKGCKEAEPAVGWRVEEASVKTSDHEGTDVPQPRSPETEEDEGTQAALITPGPKLMEPCSPIQVLKDDYEQHPHAEGTQETGWQLEGGCEALERADDDQEFGLGEIPEGLRDWEENREESEADELGETLPDSTPLGLYLRSPASPKWDLAGEQRLSPQGEARKEGWSPAVLITQGLSNPPEEEQGHDSELSSEEFEDLAAEASLLPGVSKEVADDLGQVPPVLDPTCWDQGEESDGFADEEESGEEGEEEEHEEGAESGTQWWGPGTSGGSFKVQDITQRRDLGHESVDVSGPWHDGLRGAAANIPQSALETVSQNSAESSGSEGSESISLEGEDKVPDHWGAPQEMTGMVPGAGDNFDASGQGPNLESEHVNGRMENGLEQCEEQGLLCGEQDQGLPLQELEVGSLKAPLVGSPVHLGPSQSLEFPLSGADGDSWSSGED